MNDGPLTVDKEEILQQLDKIISSELFRSEKNQQLLIYLVNKTLENEPPKETTIALEFFEHDINEKDTSYVRVAVYHLRKKLKEYYLTEGKDDPLRLSLEKGSYEVLYQKIPPSNKAVSIGSQALWITIAILVTVCIGLIIKLYLYNQPDTKRNSFLYNDLSANDKPVLIVLGDLFMYVEKDGTMVRNYSINKLEELEARKPELLSLNQSRSKILTRLHAISIFNISTLINDLNKEVHFRMASELSIEDLKENNIIYIGLFKSLYLLDTYYKISHYRPGPGMSYLIRKATNDTISIVGNPAEMHKDYGILTRMKGLENNVIYLMGGFTDTSVEMISSRIHQEHFFEKTIAGEFADNRLPENFEILFEVDGYDRKEVSNMGIVNAHELQNISGMWN
tara:strand:+ start:8108 stop:9292 length:1185 start_codon:yes stop_codon:yes gene_type:complete